MNSDTIPFKSPLVVGYRGEIGRFILQGLLRIMPKASDIWCFDINETEKEKLDRIKKSDTIFLCVPLEETKEWLNKYSSKLGSKIVIEQTSLKDWITSKTLNDINLFSMHILFRPSVTPNREDRKVILIRRKSNKYWTYNLQEAVKEITDSEIIYIDTQEHHDLLMAYQQALIHRVLLTLEKSICKFPGETYIGKKVKELVSRIKAGNSKLYSLIQGNEQLPKALREFNKNLKNFNIEEEMR
jgi:prephenate dehydrogenase